MVCPAQAALRAASAKACRQSISHLEQACALPAAGRRERLTLPVCEDFRRCAVPRQTRGEPPWSNGQFRKLMNSTWPKVHVRQATICAHGKLRCGSPPYAEPPPLSRLPHLEERRRWRPAGLSTAEAHSRAAFALQTITLSYSRGAPLASG